MKPTIPFKAPIRLFSTALALLFLVIGNLGAQTFNYALDLTDAMHHRVGVTLQVSGLTGDTTEFVMPSWSPGFYQFLNFADSVEAFTATRSNGQPAEWVRRGRHAWRVANGDGRLTLNYRVRVSGSRTFVGFSYLGPDRAFIIPASTCMYAIGRISSPATVQLKTLPSWTRIATGLDSLPGRKDAFRAADMDMLYDAPILCGPLEEFPAFQVNGIPHRFLAYKPGDFDRRSFMDDLRRVVTAGTQIIGDIPYSRYTFISIGPGRGGIEHLNSTAVGFQGDDLKTQEGRIRVLHFLGHEYFHHYNVKRIRPMELGPFDYENGSRTRQLWISEGVNVYYEYLVVKRAGISTLDEMLKAFHDNLMAYQVKSGRLYQSLVGASMDTWAEGANNQNVSGAMQGDDVVNKTISYYEKGPVVGLMLDFAIRHHSQNKKSLDDVMRFLYGEYYKKRHRGFTEAEFQRACETAAGASLADFFLYVYTVKEPDYKKYFAYGGFDIDTVSRELPNLYTGLNLRLRQDTLVITSADLNSPAAEAGLHGGIKVISVDGKKATPASMDAARMAKQAGEDMTLTVMGPDGKKDVLVKLVKKWEAPYTITVLPNPDALQKEILESWGRVTVQ
jgi:predicted metalloprotease with PDZ domain